MLDFFATLFIGSVAAVITGGFAAALLAVCAAIGYVIENLDQNWRK